MPDVQDTSDYKLSKSGRKVRAHKIVFNKGEEEQMKNPQVNEVLSKDDPASKWIKDFVHSDNPKFEGKSKKKRINMALGAYYSAQRGGVKEDIDMEVISIAEMIDRVRETLDEEQDSKHFEIYDTKTLKPLHTFKAKHMSHANIKADDWLESQGKTGKGLKVRPAKQGVTEEVELDEEQLDELKKSTLMRYASKATKSAIGLGVKAARARDEDDMATWAKNRNKAEKRDRNVQKAIAKIRSEEVELDEAIRIGSKVKIHAPGKDYHEKVGYVGEIRDGLFKGAPKKYTIDYDHNPGSGYSRSVQLDKKNVKLHSEEVEQIDELSKNTLKSYKYKAGQDARTHDSASLKAFKQGDKEKDDAHFNKSVKRMAGVSKAIDKLLKKGVKEEVEQVEGDQLDEDSYTGKGNNRPGWMLRADPELAKKFKEKKELARKRQAAFGNPAAGKSVKEDVEQIDELKKSTIRSYANKKQAELDDVPSYPFKKKPMTKQQHANAARGMMGALQRLSGRKPTSEEVEQVDELSSSTIDRYRKKLGTTLDTKPAYTTAAKTAQKEKNAPIRAKIHNALMKQHQAIRRERVMSEGVAEEVELDEAVQVSHDRYMRSHQKMASGRGNWMFTHKRSGDVNYRNDSEVHQASGSFADAKKSAKMWAQKHGHSTVYVME